MDKVGIAVVGCGMMAQGMHLPNVVRHPEIDLLWCCDVREDNLDTAQAKFSPKRVTRDAAQVAADPQVQGVLISTTHTARLQLIELFARAGKHIYVEKPLADTFEEMKKILAVVKETGIKFTVGHNRRMSPAVQEAIRILRKHRANPQSPAWRWNREGDNRPHLDGEKSTMVLLRVNDDYWSWKLWAYAHGSLINEMTHFADLACYFIDSRPVGVSVTGSKDANQAVTMHYEDGSIATIFATAFGSFGYPKELVEVYHDGAAIVLDHLMEVRTAGVVDVPFRTTFPIMTTDPRYSGLKGIEGYYQAVAMAQQEAIAKDDTSLLAPGPDKGHYHLLTDWVHCIGDGGEPVCNASAAAMPTAIILRAMESVEKGGAIVEVQPEDYTA